MEWNKENTILLIEYFKEKRELWDSTSVDFKDRIKKHYAWKDLAAKFNTERSVVERKMRSLIGQFQRELKNLKSGSGEKEITSKWFGFQLLLFLKDKYKVHSSSEASISEENPQEAASNTQDFVSPKKKKKNNFGSLEKHKEAYGTTKKLHADRELRDDFTIFGEHIACRLRNLRDPFIISTLQNQIHNTIFQAEMSLYGGGASTSFNRDYFQSPQTNSSGIMGSPCYVDTDTSQFSEDSTFKRELNE